MHRGNILKQTSNILERASLREHPNTSFFPTGNTYHDFERSNPHPELLPSPEHFLMPAELLQQPQHLPPQAPVFQMLSTQQGQAINSSHQATQPHAQTRAGILGMPSQRVGEAAPVATSAMTVPLYPSVRLELPRINGSLSPPAAFWFCTQQM